MHALLQTNPNHLQQWMRLHQSRAVLCSSGGRMNGLITALSSRRSRPVAGPRALLVVCALLLLLPTLYAQTTGALLGTVSDQSGAVVPDAKVALQNENSGDIREVATNEVGRFTFAGVQPGTYTIRVTSANFKTWKRTGFVMNAADTQRPLRYQAGNWKRQSGCDSGSVHHHRQGQMDLGFGCL
jgi:Carboxypeptidase regulatory-like domain